MTKARWLRGKGKSDHVARPVSVTLIALTQFVKAGVILFAIWLVWQRPGPQFHSGKFWEVFYLLTNGRGESDLLAPLIAAYALIVGCGLWLLEKWARRTLMITSGVTALYWTLSLLNETGRLDAFSEHLPLYSYDLHSLYVLVFIDVAVLLYLAFGHDVPESFARLG